MYDFHKYKFIIHLYIFIDLLVAFLLHIKATKILLSGE